MKNQKYLERGTKRYKGNLHCHSVNSDGRLTPAELVKMYRENGYSFLCFSEHEKYTDLRSELDTSDFILLPGLEASARLMVKEGSHDVLKTHHIHGVLGTEKMRRQAGQPVWEHMEEIPYPVYYGEWNGAEAAQKVCDNMTSRGCIAIYNHPLWSKVRESDFIDTDGFTALEVFNYGTENECGLGRDTARWDVMLREGKKIFAVAGDDNHNTGEYEDSFGGYIVVQAAGLSQEEIVQAIIDGTYYSSSGPEIYDWGIQDSIVYVNCSDVHRIHFVVGNHVGDGITYMGKSMEDVINSAEYALKGHETYIRVECVDKYGRCAWSNPIFL